MANDYDKTAREHEFDEIVEMLFNHFKNIGINIFEWKRKSGEDLSTLSEGLTSELIEEYLFDKGKSIFVKDDTLGYLNLKALPTNLQNVYNKPTSYRAVGNNYNKEYKAEDCVIIKDNSTMTPTADAIGFYCEKLADIELTKQLNRDAHKTPLMIETTESTLLSAKNTFKKIKASEPVIFVNKTRGENDKGVEALNTNIPYIIDKLEDDYNCYVAKILTILGLDNFVEDKGERVQSAEVESNDEYVISSFRGRLNERQKACDKINKMFGLDLYVDYVKGEQIEADENVEDKENEETKKMEGSDNE